MQNHAWPVSCLWVWTNYNKFSAIN
jgi:hypothetical protein